MKAKNETKRFYTIFLKKYVLVYYKSFNQYLFPKKQYLQLNSLYNKSAEVNSPANKPVLLTPK